MLKKIWVVGTMTRSQALTHGLNDPANHKICLESVNKAIEANAVAGFRNVICFPGGRNNLDDRSGIQHCPTVPNRIIAVAETNAPSLICVFSRAHHQRLGSDNHVAGQAANKTPHLQDRQGGKNP